MREDIDINIFKKQLEEELSLVEKELAQKDEFLTDSADESETADKMEEMEETEAVSSELEKRHKDLEDALEKIEEGKYGFCEVSGEPIEEDRLLANPAARTCKQHMN